MNVNHWFAFFAMIGLVTCVYVALEVTSKALWWILDKLAN